MKRKNAAAEITVTRIAGGWSKSMTAYAKTIRAWCRAALGKGRGSVCVVLADDASLRDLNRTFRGKDKPTNVLSFEGEGEELGDIVLAYETVKREAKEQGKSFASHTAHLVVHGCLHLLGHDHERERDAEKMEALEISILARLGFPDPYNAAA
jgi:probable rRNA maturation factor